jgi:predicted nucleotidyltransferase
MDEITKHIDQIRKLCGSNNVKSLFAFGSVLTEDFKIESDIDLIVDIDEKDPLSYSDSYFNLKFQLEQLFQRKVDLLEKKALKNPYLREKLEHTMVRIYG